MTRLFAFALLLAGASAVRAFPAQFEHEPHYWYTDWKRGVMVAERTMRPMILLFTAPEDQTSHATYVRLTTDLPILRIVGPFVRIALEQPDFGIGYGQFRITRLPSIVVLTPEGRKVGEVAVPPDTEDPQWVEALAEACARALPAPCGLPCPETPCPEPACAARGKAAVQAKPRPAVRPAPPAGPPASIRRKRSARGGS